MTTVRSYSSPLAFKQALEQRLRNFCHSGAQLPRTRQLLVFDRFLARLTAVLGDAVTLKGGLVLELRLDRARTTKDVDVRMMGSPATTLANLQRAGRLDLGDFMAFEVLPDRAHPDIQNDALKYDGQRFQVECKLASKLYGQPFGVDVAFGEPLFGDPDRITAPDLLGFAGVAPPTLLVCPLETHIAEKLHAYTMPRSRPNSRVKDLPDLALLATVRPIDAKRLRRALEQTFSFRATHSLPQAVPEPASAWATPYATMAREDQLIWSDLRSVTDAVGRFLNPILGGMSGATWEPEGWRWKRS